MSRRYENTYIYLMGNIPFIFKSKVGISRHTKARVSNVDKTTKGVAFFVIPPVKLMAGYLFEQLFHRIYRMFNAPFRRGSGRTEWFHNINPVAGVLIWYFFPNIPAVALIPIFISPFIWLDAVIWILAFWAINIIFIAAILIAVYHFLT